MKVNFNRIIVPSTRENTLNILTKFIQCKICMNLLNDPFDCLCCNQTFCKSCIINYIKANNKCPFSEFFEINKQNDNNKKINISELLSKIKPSSSNFTKLIQSLKFYCQFKDKGCSLELNIEEILEHEKLCKYRGQNMKLESNNNTKKNLPIVLKNIKDKDKEKLKKNNVVDYFSNFDSNKDLLKNNLNNPINHQDSVVSFSGIKNLSGNMDLNAFQINENSFINNSKIENSIDEINQKLSYINNFIRNNYEIKFREEIKPKLKNEILKEMPNYNQSDSTLKDEKKQFEKNSMTITNNFYDGSYINNLNNFTQETMDKNTFQISNVQSKMASYKTIANKYNQKEKEKEINLKKNLNLLNKTLKPPKPTVQYLLTERGGKDGISAKTKTNLIFKKKQKIKNKFNFNKEIGIFGKKEKDKNKDKEKDSNGKKDKDKDIVRNQNLKDESNETPKLGGRTQKQIKDIKPFDMSLKLNECLNLKSNSVCGRNEGNFNLNLNDSISLEIKNLNHKLNSIERLLQINNSFKNQAYSIQNEDGSGDIQNEEIIRASIKSSKKEEKEKKKENVEKNKELDESIKKYIEEIIIQSEISIKTAFNEKIEELKKYIGKECIEEMKKSSLETNLDVMTLCKEKLDQFENLLNEKINN